MTGVTMEKRIAEQAVTADPSEQEEIASQGQVRFWNPAPGIAGDFDCAYLDGGMALPHVHEDWQFAVSALPSAVSIGAFRRYIARPDNVTVVHPYEAHTEHGIAGGPRRLWVLHVAPSVVNQLYRQSNGQAPRFASPVVHDGPSADTLRELLRNSLTGSLSGEDFITQALAWLLQMLQRHALGADTPRGPNSAQPSIERARAYLQAHATEPLLLSDLVGLAGVTTSHLVRSFSRKIGLPPKSYQTQLRLARARRLLSQGKPATWVAYECGFADQSHLSRRFKEFYGLTPGAFHSQYQIRPGITLTVGVDAA